MPSSFSSTYSLSDAEALARNLGIRLLTLPIAEPVEAFLGVLKEPFAGTEPGLAEENLQARVRGTLLMSLSNKAGSLVLTTGNKSELAVGYCTLYGDMAGGFAVIRDVPKTLVYALARWRNGAGVVIPQSVLDKPPSAELRPGQLDTDSLPPRGPRPDPGGLRRGRRQPRRAGRQGLRPRHRGRGRPPGRRGRVQAPPGPARPQGHRPLLRQGSPPAHHQPLPASPT